MKKIKFSNRNKTPINLVNATAPLLPSSSTVLLFVFNVTRLNGNKSAYINVMKILFLKKQNIIILHCE